MPRYSILPLICLLLSACNYIADARGTATAVARQDVPRATQGIGGQEAQNNADLMGENQAAATLEPYRTPTQCSQCTLVVLALNATGTAQGWAYRVSTETKSVSLTQAAYIAASQTAQPPAMTATMKAQSTANALIVLQVTVNAGHETATYAAPFANATAARLIADAKFADVNAVGQTATGFLFSLSGLLAVLVIGLAVLFRPRTQTNELESEWITTGPTSQALRGSSADKLSINIRPSAYASYLQYALDGHSLGVNAVKRSSLVSATPAEIDAVTEAMNERGYISVEKIARGGTRNVLSGTGLVFAADELGRLNGTPAPAQDVAQTEPPTQHERAETSVFEQGSGVVDHFDILKDGEK